MPLVDQTNPHCHSLTRQLVELLGRPFSQRDREKATLHLLDWIACSVGGAITPVGRVILSYALEQPPGPCVTIGAGRLTTESAAFVNGSLGNILEMDDTHSASIVHPGPVVIPAALATAEYLGSSGTDFLESIVRGYEAIVRVASAAGLKHYRTFQTNATCGPFGAVVAAGSLLHLDNASMVNALGNAGTLASGLWQMQSEGAMSKHFHTARAAQTGVVCAHLASKGFTGPTLILEGKRGFFATLCGDAKPEAVTADPEASWKIHEVGFKPWPVCASVRPPLGAALDLRSRVDLTKVVKIKIRTFEEALRFCDNPAPTTTKEARFSIQHAVAVALIDGWPQLEAFELPTINRADVSRLRKIVDIESSERFSSAYPEHRGAEVEVQLGDGQCFASVLNDAPGDVGNPMATDAIKEKARMLLSVGRLPMRVVDQILTAVEALVHGGSLESLSGPLATWRASSP